MGKIEKNNDLFYFYFSTAKMNILQSPEPAAMKMSFKASKVLTLRDGCGLNYPYIYIIRWSSKAASIHVEGFKMYTHARECNSWWNINKGWTRGSEATIPPASCQRDAPLWCMRSLSYYISSRIYYLDLLWKLHPILWSVEMPPLLIFVFWWRLFPYVEI